MDKVHSGSDEENSNQSSFLMKADPILRVNPHRHTLQLASPRLERMSMTYTSTLDQKAAKENLSLLQTDPVSIAIGRNRKSEESLAHNQKMTQFVVNVQKRENEDVSQFDTAPMSIIRRKRAKKKFKTFFANSMVILGGTLFLGMLVAIIIVITGSVAKVEASIIFLIALSYVTSSQVKRLYRARKRAYLTVAQLLQVDKEVPTTTKDEDMEHLKLIKLDTSTYLHGLVAKDLEKVL